MREQDAPVESLVVAPGSSLPLPGADAVAAAWSDRSPAGVTPQHPEKATAVSAALLVLGAALLLFFPLGGALLLVSGGLGLAICWETPMGGLAVAPSLTTSAATAIQSRAPSTDH